MEENWYEDDVFWAAVAPLIFDEAHWAKAPKEVKQITRLLGLPAHAAVLDVCCGTGRHCLELARHGFRVMGVDRTSAYLAVARQRVQADGLTVEFVQEDIRSFFRESAFDAAICMGNSFGYFEDQEDDRRVVRNVLQSLRPGGGFLLDVRSKEFIARVFREHAELDEQGYHITVESRIADGWSWIEDRWIFEKAGERREFRFAHRLYSGAELSALLKNCGFAEACTYGNLDGGPYDHTMKRLVAVARK
jgi:SAM-dependent methyltransferase